MNSGNILYKTAELVRDDVGCYYFICLQCGKDFENLDDTVEHIEKYFYEVNDDNNDEEHSTSMTANESDFAMNDVDVETVVTNIKKESSEEYEDYKFAIPEISHDVSDTDGNVAIYCPLCAKTISSSDGLLESHLITVHNRSKNHAKIFECEICGKNSFTRSHDLERHKLIHSRNAAKFASQQAKLNGGVVIRSDIYNRLSDSDVKLNIKKPISTSQTTNVNARDASAVVKLNMKKPISSTLQTSNVNVKNTLAMTVEKVTSSGMTTLQRKVVPNGTHTNTLNGIDSKMFVNRPVKVKPVNYCSICRKACSKDETLESHLMQVHRRHKKFAKLYECTICGKNTFTRPYDLRRHELIHLSRNRKDRKGYIPPKSIKVEQNIQTIQHSANANPVKITKALHGKCEKKNPMAVQQTISSIPMNDATANKVLCAICNKKFDTYLDVTMHLKSEHNQKRTYKCSYSNCTAGSFSTSFFLHRHEISHSVHYRNSMSNHLYRMNCLFCRRSFNKKYNLLQHEKRHLMEMSKKSKSNN